MRLIGLDWGVVRIGVAVSDPLNISAQPIEYIDSNRKFTNKLKLVVEKYKAEEVIVGLPKNLSGEEGPSAENARKMADRIIKDIGIKVTFWDERMTSKMAERSLIDIGNSREKRKELIDSTSAAMMLQSYMDSQKI